MVSSMLSSLIKWVNLCWIWLMMSPTFLGEETALFWQIDTVGGYIGEFPSPMYPWSNQLYPSPIIEGWVMSVLTTQPPLRCPIMVENMGEGDPC